MTARLAALLTALALLVPATAAAQNDAFGPLPPPPPEPTPQPTADPRLAGDDGDVSRTMLFTIGGALLLVFVGIGYVITRDARATLPADRRGPAQQRDQGPHRHELQAKAKARAKGRQQRKARKTTRRRTR